MADKVSHEYPYRYSAAVALGPAVGFGILGVLLAVTGWTTRQGFVLFGLIRFSPLAAKITARMFAVLFLGLFVACLPIVVNYLTCRRRLALTDTALLIPRSFWSSAYRSIRYEEIVELGPHLDAQGNRSLIVRYRTGKFPIEEIALPSKEAFEEISSFLLEQRALAGLRPLASPSGRSKGARG